MKRIALIISVIIVLTAIVVRVVIMKSGEDNPFNILLITVDTLVPERLGCYGHTRNTSPAIDMLASEGVRFETSYSVAGWTLPAIATIFTGRYPSEHGATDFHWFMSDDLETMAGIFRSEGYDTWGYVSHIVLQPSFGIARGFKHYDYSVLQYGYPHDVATAEQLTDLVINDMRNIEEPFFIWVHYFDPHFEYLSHEKWARFGNADLDRYDQEIAHTDYHISRLFSQLHKKNYYDDTIIIFTSDHGEEFGEHGGHLHYTLYEEVLKVPLIIKAPGIEPGVSQTVAEQTDLLPTILAMAKIEYGKNLPGKNLLEVAGNDDPIFLERDRPPPYNQRAVIAGGYKLIAIELADITKIPEGSRGTYASVPNVHPGLYMYNLSDDPAEKHNLYSESDPGTRKLLVMLAERFSRERTVAEEIKIDEKLNEKLRSLGYIR